MKNIIITFDKNKNQVYTDFNKSNWAKLNVDKSEINIKKWWENKNDIWLFSKRYKGRFSFTRGI